MSKGQTFVIKDDEGLDVNAQDKDGLTALHHAVIHEFAKVIGMLLAHPQAMAVDAKDKQITTWGELKGR